MKKYIIRNADGREQNIMQAVHSSYNEAVETLMDYLNANNGYLSPKDPDYLSPFDFTVEEVDVKDVNETITDFEGARETLGLKPNVAYIPKSGDVKRLVTDINPKHIEALIALNKLFTIAEAWNKEDGFVPDFSNKEQDKWFPWFVYHENETKFVYIRVGNTPTFAYASVGSRLCFKTSKRAEQFGKQFAELYNKVFL